MMRVNVLCRNLNADRVIPRFSRYLAEVNGWSLTARLEAGAAAYYLSGYFEWPVMAQGLRAAVKNRTPVGAYLTHREEAPSSGGKAMQFDAVSRLVDLRVCTAAQYAEMVEGRGMTALIKPPVERERFTIPLRQAPLRQAQGPALRQAQGPGLRQAQGPALRQAQGPLVCGFSGYTYSNRRKGEDLARMLVEEFGGNKKQKLGKLSFLASGRGWPCVTRAYPWAEMPAFYQGLDVLVVTSRVEGVPMPPLEALACGVSVVIPRGVGLLDELPDTLGIHRYARGQAADLVRAFEEAVQARPEVVQNSAFREALRALTADYTVANWCAQHRHAFEEMMDLEAPMVRRPETGDRGPETADRRRRTAIEKAGTRGIYCVAFGAPARNCARRMMETAQRQMPEIPICFVGAAPVGLEDVFIEHEDADIGGRRAKLKAYELAPAEWEAVLYLDVDTEVVGDIRLYFELIEDGWEFVICKDPHLMDTMHHFRRPNNLAELEETAEEIHTLHTLQYNGGVWAFGRNERVANFFQRWQAEYERHLQRDQGALIRAMYADPLKIYLLGNEWNTFPKYSRGVETAGLMHYPGRARRWKGLIPGRIDSDVAWARVAAFEGQQGGRHG